MCFDLLFVGQLFTCVGFYGYFAVARDVVQMVANAVQSLGILAKSFGDFNHDFGVAFGGGGKIA